MKKAIALLAGTLLIFSLSACQPTTQQQEAASDSEKTVQASDASANSEATARGAEAENSVSAAQPNSQSETRATAEEASEMKITITAGDHAVNATLYDNESARLLWDSLPVTYPMANLYSREMCYRMGNGTLPANEAEYVGYEIGDISYWPPAGSLVILYEQNGEVFERQPMGHIDDDIAFFSEMSNADVTFAKA